MKLKSFFPNTRIENYFFFLVTLFSVGSMIYLNDMYIPAEILRLSSSVIFFGVTIFCLPHIRNPHFLAYSLLLIWMVFVTFMMFVAPGKSSVFDPTLKGTIANIFLSPQVMPSFFPVSILLFSSKRIVDIGYFHKLCLILVIAYLIFYPFAFYNMITYEWDLNTRFEEEGSYYNFTVHGSMGIVNILPPVIMIFWKKYLPRIEWLLFFLAYMGDLVISLFMARRGFAFMNVLSIVSFCLLYFKYDSTRVTKFHFFILFLVVLVIIYFLYINFSEDFLETILERGFEDTRSSVTRGFWKDVTGIDAIIGRGWLGVYYEEHFDDPYRREIETGFLALILRGGWIYLVLYLSVLLYSAYKGLFSSRSIFVKSFAVLILLHIVDLYPHGWPAFSLNYFSIWLGVYICLFNPYRHLSDMEIKALFFNKLSK